MQRFLKIATVLIAGTAACVLAGCQMDGQTASFKASGNCAMTGSSCSSKGGRDLGGRDGRDGRGGHGKDG